MDAGCERHGYASDVTRCWPVNGRFSSEQAAVYQVVQHVHRLDFLPTHVDVASVHEKRCQYNSLKAYMESAVNEAGCMLLGCYACSTGPTAGQEIA